MAAHRKLIMYSIGVAMVFCGTNDCTAQPIPEPTQGCKIRYTYDAAGNRTKREWYCWSGSGGSMAPDTGAHKASALVLENNKLSVFPSPANERITVTLAMPIDDGWVEVMDMSGQVLKRERMSGVQSELDVTPWAAGSYYLAISSGNERLISLFTIATR